MNVRGGRRIFVLGLAVCGWAPGIWAGEPGEPAKPDSTPDKSQYTLFHPVPDGRLRDLITDRPDQSTSPHTVDAGHYQLEMSLADYTLDRHNPDRVRVDMDQWNVAPVELRVGLTKNTEIAFFYDGYLNLRTRDHVAHTDRTQSGFGDLTLQGKYCLFGNDGAVAFGVVPYLKIPTNTAGLGNKHVEGGVVLPLEMNLPHDFDLVLQTEFDALRNDADTRHEAVFTNVATLSYDIIAKKFEVYGEFYSRVNAGADSRVLATVDSGLVYYIGKNSEIDVGCNFGVTRAAPDFEPFTGLSVRF